MSDDATVWRVNDDGSITAIGTVPKGALFQASGEDADLLAVLPGLKSIGRETFVVDFTIKYARVCPLCGLTFSLHDLTPRASIGDEDLGPICDACAVENLVK